MKKLSKKQKLLLEPVILTLIGIISILLWNTFLIYPIKIFAVLIHEISHGIVALLTGGHINNIQIYWNLGGQCNSSGGSKLLIAVAGYSGSIIVGASFFLSAYSKKHSKYFNTAFAVLLILIVSNWISGTAGIIFSVLLAAFLFISPRYFPNIVHFYLMKIIGLVSVLYSVADIKEDLLTKSFVQTDASLLQNITGISSIFWGLLWFFISIGTVIFLLYYSYKKGLQRY